MQIQLQEVLQRVLDKLKTIFTKLDKKTEIVKAWKNPSPSSEFGAKTINCDLSDCDGVLFLTLWQNSGAGGCNSQYIPMGEKAALFVPYYLNVYREATVTPTGVTFGKGVLVGTYGVTTTGRNDLAIPYEFYKVKGVTTATE